MGTRVRRSSRNVGIARSGAMTTEYTEVKFQGRYECEGVEAVVARGANRRPDVSDRTNPLILMFIVMLGFRRL